MGKAKARIWLPLLVVFLLVVLVLVISSSRSSTFRKSEASIPTKQSTLLLGTPHQEDGSKFVDVLLNTYNNPVSGVDIKLSYNPGDVVVKGVTKSSASPFSSYPVIKYDQKKGSINIAANIGIGERAQAVRGTEIKIAEIRYDLVNINASTIFKFDFVSGARNDSNVVLMPSHPGEEPVDILTSVSDLKPESSTPEASPVAAPAGKSFFVGLWNFLRGNK